MKIVLILLAAFAFCFSDYPGERIVARLTKNTVRDVDDIIDQVIDQADELIDQVIEQESTGLELANRQRANRSLGSLVPDPSLEALALERATRAASGRVRGHLGGSLGDASKEGIGYGSGREFRACYLYTAPTGTPAGAAIVQGSDGLFYSCLLLDYPGSLATGSTSRRGFRLFRFRR